MALWAKLQTLGTKETRPNMEIWLTSLGAILEYYYNMQCNEYGPF